MKIIYHCFGGAHSSVTCAAIHLGLLPDDRIPETEELMAIPFYDNTTAWDYGTIRYMGIDERGHEIYVLGKKGMGTRINNILLGIAEMAGLRDQVLVVNTMPYVNILMMMGGFMSRRLGLVTWGRPILLWGERLAYQDLVTLTHTVKFKIL